MDTTRLRVRVESLRDKALSNSWPDEKVDEIYGLCDEVEKLQSDIEVLNETISGYQKDD